jgi:hypothetical protein
MKNWRDLSTKHRLILVALLMMSVQSLLYLVVDLPRSTGEVALGGVLGTSVFLAAGYSFVVYYRRWAAISSNAAPDRAQRKGWVRILQRCTVSLIAIYLLLVAFPQPLYPYKASHRNFVVYSDTPVGDEIRVVIDRASALLETSPAYDSTSVQTIFLSRGWTKLHLFAGTWFGAFAVRSPLRGHIFIGGADPREDRTTRSTERHNERPLSSVLAHEAMHNLLRAHPHGRGLPTWKEEGYAEYVAGESSFEYEDGIRLLKNGEVDRSMSFRYFTYRMMVAYMLEERGVLFSEFLRTPYDSNAIRVQTARWLSSPMRT